MLLKDTARFWDVRFDVPQKYSVKQTDGLFREYDSKQHKLACVAAATIADAIAMVMEEWPTATIWQAINHGRECNVLVAEPVCPTLRITGPEKRHENRRDSDGSR